MPEPTCRLFVGLVPDEATRAALLAWRARWAWPRGTALSAPAHAHLTLSFLGETEAARLPALRAALDTVAVAPFTLRLGRPEAWHHGLVVLRPDPCEALDALHGRVAAALRSAGFPAGEARWKPHLTLARKAAGAQPPAVPPDIDWPVRGFALVWSRLPPQVPVARYERVAAWGEVPPIPGR